MRSYSLSSAPDAGTYRISVKQEPHGIASSYLNHHLEPGAVLDVAAPRGDFVLDDGTGPVLLISAGIGVTPVLSMLHQLAESRSERDIWWLHGARGPHEHPFAAEAHDLLASLPHAREHVFYSDATPAERRRAHAAAGRLTKEVLAGLGIPAGASAYICGPASFMTDMRDALTAIGVDPAPHPHRAVRGAGLDQPRPDRPDPAASASAARARRVPGRWSPSPAAASPCRSATTGAASWTSPTPATSPPAGAAAPASATPASRPCSPATSPTPRIRWNPQPTGRSSSAAPSPPPKSSWTCRRQPA